MANHLLLIPKVLKWEGGFVNHPSDKGGPTNKGVTLSTFRKYFGKTKTVDDLKNITNEQWQYIFKNGYWDRWKADEIKTQSIAELLVDWVYNSGVWGIKYPQQVLGVVPDGVVGPKTLASINNYANQEELFNRLWNRRKKHYEDIVKKNPSQKVFLRGWLNRLNSFRYNS